MHKTNMSVVATLIACVLVGMEPCCDIFVTRLTKYMVLSLPSRQCHANKFGLFLDLLLSWYNVFGLNCKPKDCIDLQCYRVSTADGGAMIYPESISFTKIQVTCKQTGKGGGWIVFMRRFDGSLSFKRTWDNYKSGFGEQGENQELWLGNENLYQLVKSFDNDRARLRIEAYSSNGTSCLTTLTSVKFTDETNNYVFSFPSGDSTHKGVVDDWMYTRYSSKHRINATSASLPSLVAWISKEAEILNSVHQRPNGLTNCT